MLELGRRSRPNVTAPVLGNSSRCIMPSLLRPGKRLKFHRKAGLDPKITWNISNGVSGARTSPHRKNIDMKRMLFTGSSGEVILRLPYTDNCGNITLKKVTSDASATTEDVLQSIYDACKPQSSNSRIEFRDMKKM
jgi:hypothetical protein